MEWGWLAKLFATVEWNIQTIGAGIVGTLTFLATLYKLYDKWSTREERRLRLLHEYLDKEEQDISALRPQILGAIEIAKYTRLDRSELNIGSDLSYAMQLIDRNDLDKAEIELSGLASRTQNKKDLISKQSEDLGLHLASINIYLAAIANRKRDHEKVIKHTSQALTVNSNDLDALKLTGQGFLIAKDMNAAWKAFDNLRKLSSGKENDRYRADAWEGMGWAQFGFGSESYAEAIRSFGNALANFNRLTPERRDNYAMGRIHRAMAEIYEQSWSGRNLHECKRHYEEAVLCFRGATRGVTQDDVRSIQDRIKSIDLQTTTELTEDVHPPGPAAQAT